MLVIHNMSTPPRTAVQAEKRGIADRIVVFSLQFALIARGVLESPEAPEKKLPKAKRYQDFPKDGSPDLRVALQARWPSPGDLFARIGEPKTLPIAADLNSAVALVHIFAALEFRARRQWPRPDSSCSPRKRCPDCP